MRDCVWIRARIGHAQALRANLRVPYFDVPLYASEALEPLLRDVRAGKRTETAALKVHERMSAVAGSDEGDPDEKACRPGEREQLRTRVSGHVVRCWRRVVSPAISPIARPASKRRSGQP
jgi:hypothetical protein